MERKPDPFWRWHQQLRDNHEQGLNKPFTPNRQYPDEHFGRFPKVA